jgi:hypothetical protein
MSVFKIWFMKRISIAVCLVVVLSGTFVSGCAVQPVSAQAILRKAFEGPDVKQIPSDSYVMIVAKVYKRVAIDQRLDPYHREPPSTYTETNWVQGVTGAMRYERRDASTGDLLTLIQIVDGNSRIVDPPLGNEIVTTLTKATPNTPAATPPPNVESSVQDERLGSIEKSEWGDAAWVISSTESVSTPVSTLTNTLPPADPTIAGLDIVSIEHEWTVDKPTNHLIRIKHTAINRDGSKVVLWDIVEERPKIGELSELPGDWFVIPTTVKPADALESELTSTRSFTPGDPVAGMTGYLLPDDQQGSKLELVTATDGVSGSMKQGQPWSSPRFEIRLAAKTGHAIEIVYRLTGRDTYFTLIQGPRTQLVSLMKKQEAVYESSRPVTVTVDGTEIRVWVAGGGQYNSDPPQVAAMFEANDLFVYAVGQKTTEKELLDFVTSLRNTGNR